MREAVQALFVVVATVAWTVATIQARDPGPFAILGSLAVLGLFAVSSKGLQRMVGRRIKRLEPMSDRLGNLMAEGGSLRLDILAGKYGGAAIDGEAGFDLAYAWSERVLKTLPTEFRALFLNDSGLTTPGARYTRAGDRSDAAQFMDRRLIRLAELQPRV